ncbi:hypothetical protein HY970_00005, partial [Candidatus Kaiserbacteria bacterium]|nr:hypothetical protein [Candidatus Kaiserbacteria bacterium]
MTDNFKDEIYFDGRRYISAYDASNIFGFTRDYVALLCRHGKVKGRRLGRNWYAEEESFRSFLALQGFEKAKRRQNLTEDRLREYHRMHSSEGRYPPRGISHTSNEQSYIEPVVNTVEKSVRHLEHAIAARPASALAAETIQKMARAATLSAGSSDAALRAAVVSSPHIPIHVVTPITDFLHRLIALTLACMLTFGTYALVDQDTARVALESIRDSSLAFIRPLEHTRDLATRAETQVALAAENPLGTLQLLAASIPHGLESLARGFNSRVDSFVYSIAFPASLVRSNAATAADGDAEVTVRVAPYASANKRESLATKSPSLVPASTPTTIVTHPVTERVIERIIEPSSPSQIASAGGITEEYLSGRLQELDNKLSSKIYSITSVSSPPASGGLANQIVLTQRIDTLRDVGISNSRFTHGDITDATITNSTISATTLNVSGISGLSTTTVTDFTSTSATTTNFFATNASTTNATSTYGYTSTFVATNATSTSLFASLARLTSGIIDTLTATVANITGLTATNATTTNATSTSLYVSGLSSLLTASTTNLTWLSATGTNATSTNLYVGNASLATASTTNLTWLNATGTNATTTNFFATTASSTNLFSIGATSTTLFSTLTHFTTGIIDTLTATAATITNLVATAITATGLTATNATTTNATSTNFYVSGPSVFTNATSSNLFTTNFVGTNATTTNFYTSRLSVDSLSANSGITSHLVPSQNATYDLGSASFYWRNAYVGTLNANNIAAASSTIAGTTASTFTINSDNVSADTEDQSIIFYRGITVPNALLSWNSTLDRFESNQPVFIQSASGSTTIPTLKLQGFSTQTANLLTLASSTGTTVFSIGNDGDATIGTSSVTNLSVTNTSTSTFTGGITTTALNLTGTATSTFSRGVSLSAGCFAIASNCIALGNISGTLGTTQGGTGQDSSGWTGIAVVNSGTWSASSTLAINRGGTGAASFGQGWIYSDGSTSVLAASTSPTVNYLVATSTTVASQFPYASSTLLTGTTISAPAMKVYINNTGLFANGTQAVSNGGVSYLDINNTSASQVGLRFYAAQSERARFDNLKGYFGIATTSPFWTLTVASS